MITAILGALLLIVVSLPLLIRATKWAYRTIILLWAREVHKAWTE